MEQKIYNQTYIYGWKMFNWTILVQLKLSNIVTAQLNLNMSWSLT